MRELRGQVMTFSVRDARPGDGTLVLSYVRKLADFEGLLESVRATEEGLERDLFARKIVHAAIAETSRDGEPIPVGFALYYGGYSTFRGGPTVYLEDLYVDGPYRRRGAARRIFAFLEGKARAWGASRIEWAVLPWNGEAKDFYRSLGAAPREGWETYRLELDGTREA